MVIRRRLDSPRPARILGNLSGCNIIVHVSPKQCTAAILIPSHIRPSKLGSTEPSTEPSRDVSRGTHRCTPVTSKRSTKLLASPLIPCLSPVARIFIKAKNVLSIYQGTCLAKIIIIRMVHATCFNSSLLDSVLILPLGFDWTEDPPVHFMMARTPDPESFNILDSYFATSFSYAAAMS